MPGICGVLSDTLDAKACLPAIRRVHAFQNLSFDEQVCQGGDYLVVTFAPAFQRSDRIGRLKDTDSFLVLEGEVFNADRLISSTETKGCVTSVASVLLASYLAKGASFVDALDGEFNIVICEPTHKRLSVFNDHIGSFPFYYCQSAQGFIFGSEKKLLLAVRPGPRTLDPVGLLQPFVHRHNLGSRTFLDGLMRLEPSSWLRYEANRLAVGRHGSHLGGQAMPSKTSKVVETWQHLLGIATSKRLAGKNRLGISLSGGLDSRAIACAIGRTVRPIWARTMGETSSPEVLCAKQIAAALGFEHSAEDIAQFQLSSAVHRIVWRTEGESQFRDGLSTLTHANTKLNCDYLIGGWLGDVSSGAHIRPFMLLPADRSQLIERIFAWYVGYARADYRLVFNPHFLERHMPSVREAFAESYKNFRDLPGAKMHEMWDLRNRQARMTISSMPVDSHVFGKVRPFFDRDYLNFVMSIPLRWRFAQSLYKSMIYSMGPEIRSIPNGNNNVYLRSSPSGNLGAFAYSKGLESMRRVSTRLPRKARARAQDSQSTGFVFQTRADPGLRRLIEEFVGSSSFDDDIFSRQGIRDVLDAHYRGLRDHADLVGILATWAVALKYFVYKDVSSCPEGAQPLLC